MPSQLQCTLRSQKKRPATVTSCAIWLLAAVGALAWASAPLGFSSGTGGQGGQRQRLKHQQQPRPQQHEQLHLRQQQQQQHQQLQQQEQQEQQQKQSFVDLRGVGVPADGGVSEDQLAAVWRLPERQGSPTEGELAQKKHPFWTRQKATPARDQAAQRSALRLPGLHEQVKRALQFHEERLAREKAVKDEFDPDNADHVATLLYRVFTVFVLWAGAMNAMAVWGPNF